MPDDAAFALFDAGLGGFCGGVLVGAGDFLLATVKDDEVAEDVEQAGFVAEFGEGAI